LIRDVRFGSFSDLRALQTDVRFSRERAEIRGWALQIRLIQKAVVGAPAAMMSEFLQYLTELGKSAPQEVRIWLVAFMECHNNHTASRCLSADLKRRRLDVRITPNSEEAA